MFGKISLVKFIAIACISSMVWLAVSAYAMTAYSITFKEYIEEDGEQFWQIRVTCTDLTTKRFIVREDQDGPWCAKDLPDFCANGRVQAAVDICSHEYEVSLNALESKNLNTEKPLPEVADSVSAQIATLLEERESIQRQRKALAQRKLDLRRRELDLQKRELDLQNRTANIK